MINSDDGFVVLYHKASVGAKIMFVSYFGTWVIGVISWLFYSDYTKNFAGFAVGMLIVSLVSATIGYGIGYGILVLYYKMKG